MRASRVPCLGLSVIALASFAAVSVGACSESVVDGSVDGSAPIPTVTGPDGGATSQPDGAPLPVVTACAAPTGAGTEHKNDITADETWTAAASPHRITFNTRILANVTIEPCAVVTVDEGYTITVGSSDKVGVLRAKGERGVDGAGKPVRREVLVRASDPAKPWGSISIATKGSVDLETVTLADAANPRSDQNGGGAIVAYGEGLTESIVKKSVRAKDLVIQGARGFGINMLALTGFTDDSGEITVKGSGRAEAPYPVRVVPGAMGSVPTLTLEGNHANEVEIDASYGGMPSDTIRARGVPYHVRGRLRVAPHADGAPSTLTIEPGVTLRFDDVTNDSGLQLGTSDVRQGILVAAGTAAQKITFTSAKATPAAANWKNIYFSYSPATGNRIEHAIIEYAGAPSGAQGYGCGPAENDASVLILSGRPSSAFIQNTTFRNGGGDTGLLLGWSSDMDGPDFLPTNTFTQVPACRVSRWRNATGNACPGSVGGSPVCF